MTDRVIVLVDMDCFYVQVEQKYKPELKGKPCVVVQYNNWQGGSIIAVNYEARDFGVKRGMRGDEAKSKCPDIHLFRVPEVRGKADLSRYREAGAAVMDVLCQFSECVERASIDEAYMDMTEVVATSIEKETLDITSSDLLNTFVVGWEDTSIDHESKRSRELGLEQWLTHINKDSTDFNPDLHLAVAAVMVEKIRAAVLSQTGFFCSAGIAHNKMLSKLSCGLNKPNRQTVLPQASVPLLFKDMPISKVRNLGGKLGDEVSKTLNITMMAELGNFPEFHLQKCFGDKTGSWLYQLSKGIDYEAVTSRQLPKSIGCGKNFPGKSSLSTLDQVQHWLLQLAEELEERLVKDRHENNRIAKTLTVGIRFQGDRGSNAISRSCTIYVYKASQLASDALKSLQKLNTAPPASRQWMPSIVSMSLCASRFVDHLDGETLNIQKYFTTSNKQEKELSNPYETVQPKDINVSEKNEPSGSTTNRNQDHLKRSPGVSDCATFTKQVDIEKCDEPYPSNIHCQNNEVENSPKKPVGFFARKMAELSAAKVLTVCSDELPLQQTGVNSCADLEKLSNTTQSVSSPHELKPEVDCVPCPQENTASSSRTIKQYFPSKNNSASVQNKPEEKLGEKGKNPNTPVQSILEELMEKCAQCGKMIPVWDKQEHEDFHVACTLQQQFDSSITTVKKPSSQAGSSKTSLTRKRKSPKKGSTSQRKKTSKKNTRTLDSYLI